MVLTDHGDGTRAPDAPQHRAGVLVIDAVELSTDDGHYIAIGLPQAPYPLRGEARDVIDDVRRLGGFGIVAHPYSAKPALRWRDWEAPFDALEWLNADSEFRDETPAQVARALARYPFRPAATLVSLLDRPDEALQQLDALTTRRRVVALAGADAHARAGFWDDEADGYRRGLFLKIPSYAASFRAFTTRVTLDRPLARDAAAGAAEIVEALRSGRVYTAVDALAAPPALEFFTRGASLVARANAIDGGAIVLRRDGRIVAEQPLPELRFEHAGREGTYRVEVHLSRAPGSPPIPWMLSNPIYVRPEGWGEPAPPGDRPPPAFTQNIQGGPWHTEQDDASAATVSRRDPPTGPVELRYALAPGPRTGQYAALVVSVGTALSNRAHLAFRARASRPMRMSVQARQPRSGERWQRSVVLDGEPREIVVRFDDMRPVGSSGPFEPAAADTVLFVVDTTNTPPGTAGTITLEDLRVER